MLGLNLWDAIDPEQAGYTIPAQPTAPPMAVPAQAQPGGIGGLLGSLFGGQRQPTQGFEGIPQREEPTWREKISTILSPALMQIGAALMSPPAQRAAILGNLGAVVQAGQKTLADDRLYRAQLAAWQKVQTKEQIPGWVYDPDTGQWTQAPSAGRVTIGKSSEKAPKLQRYFDESGRERMGYWNGTEMVPYGGAKAKEPKEFAPQWQTYVNPKDPTDIVTIPKGEPAPQGYTVPTLVPKPKEPPPQWVTYVNPKDPTDIKIVPKGEPPPPGYTLPTLIPKGKKGRLSQQQTVIPGIPPEAGGTLQSGGIAPAPAGQATFPTPSSPLQGMSLQQLIELRNKKLRGQ